MNLKEFSQLLGLSQTTISRALNGYPEVNEETRARVLKAAAETGYRPNRVARRLATGKVGSLGIVMPITPEQPVDIHFAEFQSGLADECLKHDFHFVIMPAAREQEEQAIRDLVSSGSIDAYYLAYMRERDPRIVMAKSLPLPFIVHGRSRNIPEDYPYLDVDNELAFFEATEHLLNLGHTRFAMLNGPTDLDFAQRRRMGVEKAMKARGLKLDPALVSSTVMTDGHGFQHMARFLDRLERPTAVLCASTVLALGAVRAIRQAGLEVGADISLIAHDDDLHLLRPEHFSTPLSTTRSSIRDAGRRVAERLIAAVNGEEIEAQERELWRAELILRASTCAAVP